MTKFVLENYVLLKSRYPSSLIHCSVSGYNRLKYPTCIALRRRFGILFTPLGKIRHLKLEFLGISYLNFFGPKKIQIIKCCNFINILNFLMRFFLEFKYSSRYARISTKSCPQVKTKHILAGLKTRMPIFRDHF